MSKRKDAQNALSELWSKPRTKTPPPAPRSASTPDAEKAPASPRPSTSPLDLMSDVLSGLGTGGNGSGENEIQLLDPKLLEPSPYQDRMGVDEDPEFDGLLESISTSGQQVPILVRPHPKEIGRYQVAYGHRRLRACRELDRSIRAIVKPLSDEELIIAQSKENLDRKDLTFIEKCLFVATLKAKGVTRAVISKALGGGNETKNSVNYYTVDISEALIRKIGPAPSIKGPKWRKLSEVFKDGKVSARQQKQLDGLMASSRWTEADSNKRFALVQNLLNESDKPKAEEETISSTSGADVVRIKRGGKATTLSINTKALNGFDAFLIEKLSGLIEEFEKKDA